MGNLRRYAENLITNSLGASKIVLKFGLPPVEITFEKQEFAAMLRSTELASRVLAECFVARRVFWTEEVSEGYEYVIKSLEAATEELRKFDREIAQGTDLSSIGYSRITRTWAIRANETKQQLVDNIAAINKEKGEDPYYDSAGNDRFQAMLQSLKDLRARVYPLVRTLIELLPDTDPVKNIAEEKLDIGLHWLGAGGIRATEPEIFEVK